MWASCPERALPHSGINDVRKRAMARKVAAALGGSMRGKLIAVLGLTFKPNTDDVRDAPSIAVITAIQDMGARVRAYDPAGIEQAKKALEGIEYAAGPYECAEDADALVIVTEWEQFRALDLKLLHRLMAKPIVVDLRKIYRTEDMVRHGFIYLSVGTAIEQSDTVVWPRICILENETR
jgi:UDPglucose 6-dehydrogenase